MAISHNFKYFSSIFLLLQSWCSILIYLRMFIEKFMKTKYCVSSNFVTLIFPFINIYENLLKHLWKEDIVFPTNLFLGFSLWYIYKNLLKIFWKKKAILLLGPSFLYVFTKIHGKIYEHKILYFRLVCYLGFSFLYIFRKTYWKFYENKIPYLSNFSVIASYFVTWIFLLFIFTKTYWKKIYISSYKIFLRF